MYCKKCGREIKDGAVFCQYCGARVEHQAEEEKPAQDQMFKFRKIDENGDPIANNQGANNQQASDQGAQDQGAQDQGAQDQSQPVSRASRQAAQAMTMSAYLILCLDRAQKRRACLGRFSNRFSRNRWKRSSRAIRTTRSSRDFCSG